jgi:recombinational DNA repair protein (RecF pathway)
MTTERTEERKNRFNGESVMLTKEEARRHDLIFMAEMMAELHNDQDVKEKHYKIMREHLDWFMKNNAKAYMVLLD